MHTFTFRETLVFLAFLSIVAVPALAGVYLIQYGTGWHWWLGAALTMVFGAYFSFLFSAFLYDILRAEFRYYFPR